MKKQSESRILEEDLAKPISEFLTKQGYLVRSEVKFCDITAVKDEHLVVVELKRSLSLDLLIQAVKRQKMAESVYIAVPKPKNFIFTAKWNDLYHLIRRLEIGLIFVSFKGSEAFVEVAIEPLPFDRVKSRQMNQKKRTKVMTEIEGRHEDLNTGGSRGKKLVTAYREHAIFIACCIDKLGPLSPKQLREIGTDPKKTTTILGKNHYSWFVKLGKGLYDLNEQGRAELRIYSQLTSFYQLKIKQYLEKRGQTDASKK